MIPLPLEKGDIELDEDALDVDDDDDEKAVAIVVVVDDDDDDDDDNNMDDDARVEVIINDAPYCKQIVRIRLTITSNISSLLLGYSLKR